MVKTTNTEDLQSVRKIAAGDTAEFRVLVERYKDLSFSLACSILKDTYLAEEALQEAFIKVFRNIRGFRERSSFATWLYKIVVTTCFTIAKKQKRMESYDDPTVSSAIEETDHTMNFDATIAYERKEIVNMALLLIKADEALALRLYYLSELDIREISEVTGFSESKVKVTLHRGRASFEVQLQKLLGTELELFIQ